MDGGETTIRAGESYIFPTCIKTGYSAERAYLPSEWLPPIEINPWRTFARDLCGDAKHSSIRFWLQSVARHVMLGKRN